MRILQIANGYPPAARGGVETYTQTLAHALAARGHEVEVFCRVSALSEPEYTVRDEHVDGLAVRRVVNDLTDVVQFADHFYNPRFDSLFRDRATRFRPDLVHVQHCLGLSATLLPTARALGLPLVVTLHDFWYFCARATLFNADRALCPGPGEGVDCVRCLGGARLGPFTFVRRWSLYKPLLARLPAGLIQKAQPTLNPGTARPPTTQPERSEHEAQTVKRTATLLDGLRLAEERLAPSEFVKASYVRHGLSAETIRVLPLGVDRIVAPPGPPPDRPFTLLYAGSFQYHKGPDVLIRAAQRLTSPDWRLRLYGSGDPADPFTAEVRAMAAGDPRLELHPPFERARLPLVLAQADVVVVPSRCHETYSLMTREALLAGVPVVASRLGALPEVVREGVNGYLVAPGEVGALAVALRQAFEQLPRLRAGARAQPAAPTVAEHAAEVESIYARAVERYATSVRG